MSDDNQVLSQAEIDALMNNDDDGDDLTDQEKDVLGEIGNIAMGSAATALYTLLNKTVSITAPEVDILNFKEITGEYDRPCVLIKVEYVAGLEGVNLLIIDEKDAAIIADLMMGGDGTDTDKELSEIHISAVGEAMNQMMGSASTSMSSIFDEVVNISPPEPKYLEMDQAVDENGDYFDPEQKVVATSFRLKVGDLIDSTFKQLATLDFTKRMVESLLSNESGLTAKDDNSQQDQVSAVTEEQSKTEETANTSTQASREAQRQQEEVAATGSQNNVEQSTGERAAPQQSNRPSGSNKVEKQSEAGVGVKKAQFPEFTDGQSQGIPHNMELIKDVPLQVTVRLGKSQMTIKEILDLGEGSIIELDKLAGEPVDLLVNGKLIAKGEVVVIDENFGFRVKDIIDPLDRLNNI